MAVGGMFSQVHLIFNHLRFQGEFWKAMSKNWSLHPCEALTVASKLPICSALKTEVAMFFFPGQVWKSYAACWHAELAMLASWGGYTHWIFFMLAISQVHSEMTASQCKGLNQFELHPLQSRCARIHINLACDWAGHTVGSRNIKKP